MAKIVLYVSGSVAAYKSVSLVRSLQKQGHELRVVMTKSAQEFVGQATFASLLHQPVLTDMWDQTNQGHVPHIELADWTELAVVVPATANIIAKLANGIADDTATSTLLATKAPKLVVPAMNNHMWDNPATQRNLKLLQADGITILDPDEGLLAEGYAGKGRMPAVERIVSVIQGLLFAPLNGQRLVVTAGGTREPIDPVRFIGNRSSGKMGIEIARAAAQAGYQVDLIVGQVEVDLPKSERIHITKVETTEEMFRVVDQAFVGADGLIMAAAVADYKVDHPADQKIKKTSATSTLSVDLTQGPDILATMGAKKQASQFVVGFAAETDHLDDHTQAKLSRKHADVIVGNNVTQAGSGFGTNTNQVTIYQPNQAPQQWKQMSKAAVAKNLIQFIQELQ